MYIALFLVSMIYILEKEENKKVKSFFIYYSIITIFITLNPIFNKVVSPIFTDSVYWRVYWVFPLGITIAYAGTKFIIEHKTKLSQILASISICIIIIISGKYIYTNSNYNKVGNLYRLPDENVLVAQLIGADEKENKKALVPETLVAHIRQIDATIELAYRRDPKGGYEDNQMVQALNSGNVEWVDIIAKTNNCNYVVFKKAVVLTDKMENYGYVKLNETENYAIYKTK